MNDGLIPNRYAKALFKLAVETGDTRQVYDQMKQLDVSFASQPMLKKAVINPFVPVDDKVALLESSAKAESGGTLGRFFRLLIKKGRIEFVRAIALAYVKLFRERNDIAQVEIVTAAPMPQEQIDKMVEVVKQQLGTKTLEIETKVDSSLIGGFIINVASQVLDASVKKQIEKLRLKLLS